MRFSDMKDLTPADVSVAKVDFRGEKVDVFRLTPEDIFFVLNQAPEVIDAMEADAAEASNYDSEDAVDVGMGGMSKLLPAIAQAGPEVINRLISSGLRATEEEIKAAHLDVEEATNILEKVLQEGIPEGFLKRLMMVFGVAAAKQGLDLSSLSAQEAK